jgi:hypothetical protein
MYPKTALVSLAALASFAMIGCGPSGGESGEHTDTSRAKLHRAKSCGDLLSDLKADAAYKLNKGIDLQIKNIRTCITKYGDAQCAYYGGYGYSGDPGVAVNAGTAAPESAQTDAAGEKASNSSSGGANSPAGANSYSETNTQVAGVDEADIVKNDGKNLYLLHGRALKVINAWPANDLQEMSTIDIEGTPTEMFVADGKIVVYSEVNGAAVFTAAGVTPKPAYGSGYGYATPARAPQPADDAEGGSPGSAPDQPYIPLTKITVLALDGTTPSVTREVYFEGSYLDSRRVGTHVRTVLQGYQYGPQLKNDVYDLRAPSPAAETTENPYPTTGTQMISALQQLRAQNLAILNQSQLSDWLPYTFVKDGNAVSAKTVACEDFYVPTAGSTESGLTDVASIDLSDPTAVPQETVILGRADTVYGNADTLYLAAHAWVEPPFAWHDQGEVAVSDGGSANEGSTAPAPAPDSAPTANRAFSSNLGPKAASGPTGTVLPWVQNRTHVHKFEFKTDPKFPNYIASGTVNGSVKNQFSLDEKDNRLRIATTENRGYITSDGKYVSADFSPPSNGSPPPARPAMVNHLFVLSQNGASLEQTGDVGELAPNEQIYSVRFVGNRGYVVTFRQVDPLFVIDLTTPQTPTLLAALKIPGFSEYMHPLGDNHLLTIGRDANAEGRAQGLQLQIFDVTNGANPIVKHKFTYSGSEYGYSEAQYDHKAFTYFAEKNLLAFPYYSYDGQSGMRSSLELFKVDLGTGFAKLGSIDHTSLVQANPTGYCGGYYSPAVRRGVFLEDFVYSISYGGIVVRDSNNLAVGSELALAAPLSAPGYGPYCY